MRPLYSAVIVTSTPRHSTFGSPRMQLIADQITAHRGGRAILSGLSFSIRSGESLLLTGPNGSGKTTLLRTIAGLNPPAAGAIRLEGGDDELDPAQQMHLVGHSNGIKASLTVRENLEFWERFLVDDDVAGGVDTAMHRLGLTRLEQIPSGYLSAGQKRRLGLARLLVAKRPVWLLDEPSVSLDEASRNALAGLIAEHVAAGGIAVAATHVPLGMTGARELRLGVASPVATGGTS